MFQPLARLDLPFRTLQALRKADTAGRCTSGSGRLGSLSAVLKIPPSLRRSRHCWPRNPVLATWHIQCASGTSSVVLQHYIGQLKRRSRCLQALARAVRLSVWHYNKHQRLILQDHKFLNALPLLFLFSHSLIVSHLDTLHGSVATTEEVC